MPQLPPVFDLGEWRVSADADLLEHGDEGVRLQPQVTRLLVYLAERAGQVVSRDELLRNVWDDRFVGDAALTTAVWELRVALGDEAKSPRFLETVPRRGYRLLVAPGTQEHEGSDRRGRALAGRGWLVAGVLGAAALLVWLAGVWRSPARTEPGDPITIAVLPIENMSEDDRQDYLAEGLTDSVITELARLSGLRVTSRTSIMTYADRREPLPEIGRQLSVERVLEGAIVLSGSRIRLTVQLIDARTDQHLWAESFERDLVDVIALQNDLAAAVAAQIPLRLSPEERLRLADRPTPSSAADHYLRGLSYLAGDPYDGDRAIEALEAAVATDPGFARAHADLALAWIGAAWEYQRDPHEVITRAREAAETAIRLDPAIGRAHYALATLHDLYDWNWPLAEEEYRRAIALDPSNAEVRRILSQFLAERGRFDEAREEAEAARACDPQNPLSDRSLGWVYYLAGRPSEALAAYRRAQTMAPESLGVRRELPLMLAEAGQIQAAIAALEKFLAERPDDLSAVAILAMVRARDGDAAGARAGLDQLLAAAERGPVSPGAIAKVYAWLGEHDAAFAWLEKALESRLPTLVQLAVSPQFAPLRSDPRLDDLLRRIGLQVAPRPESRLARR